MGSLSAVHSGVCLEIESGGPFKCPFSAPSEGGFEGPLGHFKSYSAVNLDLHPGCGHTWDCIEKSNPAVYPRVHSVMHLRLWCRGSSAGPYGAPSRATCEGAVHLLVKGIQTVIGSQSGSESARHSGVHPGIHPGVHYPGIHPGPHLRVHSGVHSAI